MDTILVIDDERNIRTLVSRVLAQDDVEVHTAGTGKEGLELAEELSPDVSLVDLRGRRRAKAPRRARDPPCRSRRCGPRRRPGRAPGRRACGCFARRR